MSFCCQIWPFINEVGNKYHGTFVRSTRRAKSMIILISLLARQPDVMVSAVSMGILVVEGEILVCF
jgi:hypothetical protein